MQLPSFRLHNIHGVACNPHCHEHSRPVSQLTHNVQRSPVKNFKVENKVITFNIEQIPVLYLCINKMKHNISADIKSFVRIRTPIKYASIITVIGLFLFCPRS